MKEPWIRVVKKAELGKRETLILQFSIVQMLMVGKKKIRKYLKNIKIKLNTCRYEFENICFVKIVAKW